MAFGSETSPSRRSAAWTTAVWLGLFVALGLFLRIGFSAGPGFDEGTQRYMYTGNDPYYHDRTVHHILETGRHLVADPAINYPDGAFNHNPPLYDWTTAPVAAVLESAGVADPVGLALNVMVAVWGALIVVPVYVLGRDLWSRAAGLWAAFLMALSAPHIQRTLFGFADHDATTLFFIVLAFAFLVKALQAVRHKEYVSDWRHGAARSAGLKAVFAENRDAFVWSALCGVALTATAVTWKGYPYALAVMAVAVALQLLNDHLRNRDSTAVFLLYLLPLALVAILPYVLLYHAFPNFIGTTVMPSLYVLAGVAAFGLMLVPTRQLPSILVFPALLLLALGALAFVYFVLPDVWAVIFTGLGYFQQSKLYSTIAEAQRADLGFVAASFGFFTFLLAFWGFGKALKGTYRGEPAFTLLFSWSAVALFMAFAAARFVLNAAPVFALLTAAPTVHLISKLGFGDVQRRFRARSGGVASGAAQSLSMRTTMGALLVGLLVVLPNAWIGVDAAMPADFEAEHDLDAQYWGAFGIGYELADNGWLETMANLSRLDTCRTGDGNCAPGDPDYLPLEERPAFIAWWDYGHWATGIGIHPTVADPFQSHFEAAGRFLASESEAEAVNVLSALLLNADRLHHGGSFSPAVQATLQAHNISAPEAVATQGYAAFHELFNRTVGLGGEAPFDLYDDLTDATGKRIQYAGVDRRMYPLSAQNEGIFYAPVYLTNKNPDDFVAVTYPAGSTTLTVKRYEYDEDGNSVQLNPPILLDPQGREYEIAGSRAYLVGQTPVQGYAEESGLALQPAQIDVKERFGRTMYARSYGGFVPTQAPGEGLRHFRAIQQSLNDIQGVQVRETVLLEYFSGAHLSGVVRDDLGAPIGGLQVAVRDGFGATHDAATTGPDGRYAIQAPFSLDGDLTIVVRSGSTVLWEDDSVQFTRDEARSGGERTRDLTVPRADLYGRTYHDRDGQPGFNATTDEPLAGVRLTLGDRNETSDSLGLWSATDLVAGSYLVRATKEGYSPAAVNVVLKANETKSQDLTLSPTPSQVNFTFLDDGVPVEFVPISITGAQTASVTTDGDGHAATFLAPGDYVASIDYAFTNPEGLEVRYDQEQNFTVPFGGAPFEVTINAE